MNLSLISLAISIEERRKRDKERKQIARLNPEYKQRERENDKRYRQRCKQSPEYVVKNREYHTNYMKQWREQNPQRDLDISRIVNAKRKEYMQEYFQKNKERLKDRKKQYYLENKDYFIKKNREWYQLNKSKISLKTQIKRRLVLEHYGNKCNCCGESTLQFLAIDHINNDGYLERKTRTIQIFEYLIRNNYPSGFQVLCHNCNLAKSFYGECPHKQK